MSLDELGLSSREMREFSERFLEIVLGIPDAGTRADLLKEMSEHYKHLARLDGIRDDAKKLDDFFSYAARHEMEYKT